MINNPRLVLFAVVAAVLLAVIFFFGLPVTAQWRMTGVLRDMGFAQAHIGKTIRSPGGYSFEKIRLDNNEFSTVEQIILQGENLTINRPVMTGDWTKLADPDIAGWVMPPGVRGMVAALAKKNIKTVTLNGGQLDISVPLLGIVRLEAKGQMTLMQDGAVRIQSVLWSVQQKMKAELKVKGEFAANGISSMDIEVVDGRLTLPAAAANRLGGWLILNKDSATAPWSVSGQILAGAARAYTLPLNAVIMSVQGTLPDAAITAQAGTPGGDDTTLNVDMHLRRAGEDSISATLRMEPFEDRPGIVAVYATSAPTMAETMNKGEISLSDLAGVPWMKGRFRRTGETMEMDVQEVSMQPLAEALGIRDLKADGVLTGLLPLRHDEKNQLVIDQGLLRAASRGALEFSGKTLPASVQSTRDDAAKMLKAFDYDFLELSVAGPALDMMEGDISLSGTPSATPDAKPVLIPLHFQGKIFGRENPAPEKAEE
jgi:hypothetical protein